jgi:hypothetical protein
VPQAAGGDGIANARKAHRNASRKTRSIVLQQNKAKQTCPNAANYLGLGGERIYVERNHHQARDEVKQLKIEYVDMPLVNMAVDGAACLHRAPVD